MATARFSYQRSFDPNDAIPLVPDYASIFSDITKEIAIGPNNGGIFAIEYGDFDDLETGLRFEDSDFVYITDGNSAYFDFSDRQATAHLKGGSGGDTLIGGAGDDDLRGGDGYDVLVGGAGADSFDGGADGDLVSYAGARRGVTADLTNTIASAGAAAGDTFRDVEHIVGSDFNDTLIGDENTNFLVGGLGNDVLRAGNGVDRDTLNGGRGHDTLYGGIYDNLIGGKGDDTFFIDGAADVDGGTGVDRLVITDSFAFENGNRITNVEKIFLSGSIVNVDFSEVVSSGLDITSQATDSAVILGTTGNDILRAGSHGDLLIAGSGNDTLIAGAGTDTLRIGPTHGRVEIRGFDIANDQLDFSETGARNFADLGITQVGGKTVINIAGETNAQRLVLTGTDSTALIANGNLFFGMD